MSSPNIIEVTNETYQTTIITSPTLVMFYADWCPFCKKALLVLDELVPDLFGKVTLAKMDTKANPEIAKVLEIGGIPAWKFIDKGIVHSWSGFSPKNVMLEKINGYLNPSQPNS